MILTFEFDNADEAGEMEYAFRDAWGHKFNTKWDGGVEVYVEVDDPRDENTPVLFFDKDYTEKRDGSLMESRKVRGRLVEGRFDDYERKQTKSELAKTALDELATLKRIVGNMQIHTAEDLLKLSDKTESNINYVGNGDWGSYYDIKQIQYGNPRIEGAVDEVVDAFNVDEFGHLSYATFQKKGNDKFEFVRTEVRNQSKRDEESDFEWDDEADEEFHEVTEEELKKLANRVEIESNVVVGGYVLADVPWHAWKTELDDESGNVRVFQGKKEIRKKGYEYVNTMLNELSRKFGGWELRAFSPEYSGSDNWELDFISYVTDDGTLFGHSKGAYEKAEEYAKKNGQEFWLYRVTLPAWTRESDEEFGYDLVEDGKGLFSDVSVNEPY